MLLRERLTPSPQIHLMLLLLLPLGFGMVAPLTIIGGIISAAICYGIALVIMVWFAPKIEIDKSKLRVGRATIDRKFVGDVSVVEPNDRYDALSDARAWLLVRAWIRRGVKIEITDKNDPTPYWYVSSRNPEAIISALNPSAKS